MKTLNLTNIGETLSLAPNAGEGNTEGRLREKRRKGLHSWIHQDFLLLLKEQLGYGYVRMRNDGMSEYTIVGLREVEIVLKLLYPFLQLKKTLARDVLDLIKIHPSQRKMTVAQLIKLSELVDKTALFNYSKKRTNTSSKVIAFLQKRNMYVPVETESTVAGR